MGQQRQIEFDDAYILAQDTGEPRKKTTGKETLWNRSLYDAIVSLLRATPGRRAEGQHGEDTLSVSDARVERAASKSQLCKRRP